MKEENHAKYKPLTGAHRELHAKRKGIKLSEPGWRGQSIPKYLVEEELGSNSVELDDGPAITQFSPTETRTGVECAVRTTDVAVPGDFALAVESDTAELMVFTR